MGKELMDPWLVQKLLSECVTAAVIISLDHPVGSLVTFLFVREAGAVWNIH